MKLTLWFLLGNVGLENLDPLFCFDSGEGDSFPLMLCFFFFLKIFLLIPKKKKPHAKWRRFSGFNGNSNGALNWQKLKVRRLNWQNWKLEDWNEKMWKLEGQFCIFTFYFLWKKPCMWMWREASRPILSWVTLG